LKQRDKYSCGPIAILNALRWADLDTPYEDWFDMLSAVCECGWPDVTLHRRFERALREIGRNFCSMRRKFRPSIKEIEDHIYGGGAVILNYKWRRKNGETNRHFSLVVDVSQGGKTFYSVNDRRAGPAYQSVHRKTFLKHNLRFRASDPPLKAWFLTLE